jgi:hypothetical protein
MHMFEIPLLLTRKFNMIDVLTRLTRRGKFYFIVQSTFQSSELTFRSGSYYHLFEKFNLSERTNIHARQTPDFVFDQAPSGNVTLQ